MKNNIKKIAVAMGGISEEREISLKSGAAVAQALEEMNFSVDRIDIQSGDEREVTRLFKGLDTDIVFIALHGRFGEDGFLQRILESLKIAFTGSDSVASGNAMDKVVSKRLFLQQGLNVPAFLAFKEFDKEASAQICQSLGMPVIIKPACSGSSIGLSLVEEQRRLNEAFLQAKRFSELVVAEKFIKGREMTVGILGNSALTPIEIRSGTGLFDFKAKYSAEDTQYIVPAPVEKAVSDNLCSVGLRAHSSLGCRGFSRADILLEKDTGRIYVLEVNTIPGLTQRSLLPKAALHLGMSFQELCLAIIDTVK